MYFRGGKEVLRYFSLLEMLFSYLQYVSETNQATSTVARAGTNKFIEHEMSTCSRNYAGSLWDRAVKMTVAQLDSFATVGIK